MFTGYSNSGAAEYNITSDRGMDFVSNAVAGSRLTGADGSSWVKNSDGSVSISRGGDNWTVGSALGQLQNTLDTIVGASDKTSARSNDYAREARDWSASQAAIANEFNAAEAAKNRDWQTYMSNTAHQREVADLRAAGLNPVLSALNGNGAAVTSGATASSVMPSSHAGTSDNISGAIASVLSSMLAAQTAIANQAVSARTQEAVADKNNAMAHLIAELNNATSASNARLASETSRYSADSARAASRYSADSSRAASKYASDNAYAASHYSADQSRIASMFAANQSSSASRYAANRSYEAKRDFPSTVYGAVSTAGQYLGSLIDDIFGESNDNFGRSSNYRGSGFNG